MLVYARHSKQEERDYEHRVELDRHCSPCNAVFPAYVIGRGHAAAPTGADAAFDAEDAAQRDAALLVRLAPCPRCGRREAAAVRSHYLAMAGGVLGGLALVAVALILVALGAFESGAMSGGSVKLVAVLGVGGLVLLVVSFKKSYARWRGSRDRVHFLPAPAPNEPQGPYRSTS